MHAKMHVFLNQPWQQNIYAHYNDSVVWKNKLKLCLEKKSARKKTAVLQTLFGENERETSQQK